MILKFLISGSCYAQTHAFSTHFLQFFLMTFFYFFKIFFCSPGFFLHIPCKNPKNLSIFIISYIFRTPRYISVPAWRKNMRGFPAMGKNQNYWGDGGQILGGGCIPSSHPGICSPGSRYILCIYISHHNTFYTLLFSYFV